MYEYLKDTQFLNLLDNVKVKTQYIKLTVLDFAENPIREIQGSVQSGSINVNGSSAIRRTINLSMFARANENNLVNLDNIISLNKKIKVEVGYKNTLISYKDIYPSVIWFPCGTYVVSSANISTSTTGCTISIQGKDKMAMLDGTAGGTLPASVVFHERYKQEENGYITIEHPTIYQIIFESVHHYGNESIDKIIISDVPLEAKMLVKYVGEQSIFFPSETNHTSFAIGAKPEDWPEAVEYTNQMDIGFKETDFTYPGELIFAAGSTVASLLDKICKTLGNFEYFYDVYGNFIFQEIKNYVNNSFSSSLEKLIDKDYLKITSNSKYAYTFNDSSAIVSITGNPKYDNIKNEYIVWGERTEGSGVTSQIRYHVAVDNKPILNLCKMYMFKKVKEDNEEKKEEVILDYKFSPTAEPPDGYTLAAPPAAEWREELYRRALVNSLSSGEEGHYDDELIAEWRKLFDPTKEAWAETGFWNPDVKNNPNVLDYWLDFIEYEGYSVNKIGYRTKVLNEKDVHTIYNRTIPDVVFVENTGTDYEEKIQHFKDNGQDYCFYTTQIGDFFQTSTTGVSCYEKICQLLYQNLTYNTTISINCLPKYYLEPNQLIYVNNKESAIQGTYTITQFSLPLNYNGTMSISATELIDNL